MSRAYRVRVAESMSRDLSASDEICADLEILEILPPEQMLGLLKESLEKRGFAEEDGKLVKKQGEVTVTVDPKDGTVSVKSEAQKKVELSQEVEGWGYDDAGPSESSLKDRLREQAKADLERKANSERERLQSEATDRLAGQLDDVRKELGRAINEVTREALKRKAQSLGEVKEISEDAEAGTLSIKVEV